MINEPLFYKLFGLCQFYLANEQIIIKKIFYLHDSFAVKRKKKQSKGQIEGPTSYRKHTLHDSVDIKYKMSRNRPTLLN